MKVLYLDQYLKAACTALAYTMFYGDLLSVEQLGHFQRRTEVCNRIYWTFLMLGLIGVPKLLGF